MQKAQTAPATMSDKQAATRALLIVKAIELFAERGLVGVSLRAVGEAAGQRNTAAVHYHFGDRETLLEAALDRVLEAAREPVDHAAARSMGLPVGDPLSPLHAAVGEIFLPILTLPLRLPWGMAAARLLGRIMLGEAAALARELECKTVGDTAEMTRVLRPLLPDMPESVLRARIDLSLLAVVCGLTASAYVEAVECSESPLMPAASQAAMLLDYVAAGLAAQYSS